MSDIRDDDDDDEVEEPPEWYASDADERAARWYDEHEDLIREDMANGDRDRRGRWIGDD